MSIRKGLLLAAPIVASFGIWAAAPAHTPASASCSIAAAMPSGLDYVILASLSDSPNVVGMAAYAAHE
jgi:hypothetical protein